MAFLSRKHRLFADIIGSSLCIFFISSIFKIVFPLFVVQTLQLTHADISIFYIFLSLGTICATVYVVKQGLKSENTLLFWILYAASILICFLQHNTALIYCLLFIAGAFGALIDICLVSNIQNHSEKQEIGKNFGFFSFLANTNESLSNLAVGYAIALLPVQTMGIVLCLAVIAIGVGFMLLKRGG